MNSSLIELLGDSVPPVFGQDERFVDSFAVSEVGNVAFLTEDGGIKLGNIRNPDRSTATTLEIYGLSKEEASSFSSMQFNSDGNMLLLWNKSRVGVLELSPEEGGMCTYTNLVNVTTVEDGPCYPIMKTGFHPLCKHCVVILHQQEGLRLVDLRTLSTQVISLAPGRSFCSFTFGPSIEWLQFSIILLSASGDLFALCPVIPTGTVVASAAVEGLWAWTDQLEYDNDPESRMFEDYLGNVQSYLAETFGPRQLSDNGSTGAKFLRAGEDAEAAAAGHFVSEGDEVVRSLSNYLPMLVGPLAVQRPSAEAELDAEDQRASAEGKSGRGERERDACDICTPGAVSSVFSTLQGYAPVLAVSYRSGAVDILMFDSAQDSAGRAGRSERGLRTTSALGPCWRSIDRTRPNLTCSGAGLLVVESLSVRDAAQAPPAGSFWRIQADPVFSHLLHASSPAACESHMLSVSWLEKVLEDDMRMQQAPSQRTSLASGEGQDWAEGSADGAGATPASHPTRVLPVFVLPPRASSASAGSAKGQAETKSARGDESTLLCGAAVLQDAMLGHVALFRTASGLVSAVNLTVHTKLCTLQESLHNHSSALELLPMKEELERATNAEQIRWRRTQQCIQKVAEGLRSMPEMDSATAAALTPQPSPHNKKVLLEAAQKLERDVLAPLNELAQTTLFSYEIVQETYRSQVEILEGSGAVASSERSLSQGLRSLVTSLDAEHDALSERVRKIQEKFAAQRDAAERHLAFAVSQRAKISKAETLYKRQLEDWSRAVSQMNEQVNALRVMSGVASVTSTPAKVAESPRAAQPPLFSLSTTNNTSQFGAPSPANARYFRSPGLMAQTPLTPGAASPAAQSPTPSKYPSAAGGRSVAFQTPQTPGTFKSATGQLYRPYSTPSAATPTPNKSGPVLMSQGTTTPGAAGGTTGRQYHTRHPPMATPSPNFYAAYRASALASAGTEGDRSVSGATVGGGSARTVRTAGTSQFGSPAPSGRATGGTAASAPAPAVSLSAEDQEACSQLLLSQTELLEKAHAELARLEEKVRTLKEQQGLRA